MGYRRGGSRVSGVLLTIVLMAIGFSNSRTDDGIVKYHNDFVQHAYSEVVIGGWNKMIDEAKKPGAEEDFVLNSINTSFIPTVDKWSKTAAQTHPPRYAEEFHNKFSSGLLLVAKDARKYLRDLEDEDEEVATASFKVWNKHVLDLESMIIEFQKNITRDRSIKFESSKKG